VGGEGATLTILLLAQVRNRHAIAGFLFLGTAVVFFLRGGLGGLPLGREDDLVTAAAVGGGWKVIRAHKWSALHALDTENDVLVDLLMHTELARLAESANAPIEIALERLLLRVDVGVLLQVLCKRERLEAQDADMLLDRTMRCNVSAE